jgi:hypothetical protein
VHRRPPVTVAPPPELVCFDPSEWPAEEWWQSCELWGRARMAWVKAHPCSSFGTALDVLREQHRLYAPPTMLIKYRAPAVLANWPQRGLSTRSALAKR